MNICNLIIKTHSINFIFNLLNYSFNRDITNGNYFYSKHISNCVKVKENFFFLSDLFFPSPWRNVNSFFSDANLSVSVFRDDKISVNEDILIKNKSELGNVQNSLH